MNARLAHVLSRLSLVAVVAASSLGAAACGGGASADSPAPPQPPPTPTVEAFAHAPAPDQHQPGRWFLKQVETLDLSADQRAAVEEIQQNLVADLTPHRETMRQVTLGLADAIERGQLDAATAAEHKAALLAAIGDAKVAFATALNGIHDTLDASQRAALVAKLREQHDRQARGLPAEGQEAAPKHGLARLAFELGLDDNQKAALHDAVQKGVDDLLPDRRERREAWEAKMQAMGEAFVTNDFDAADWDLAEHAEEHLAAAMQVASRAVAVSGSVLSDAQREAAADLIRTRAEKM